jgi:hypothetical protein
MAPLAGFALLCQNAAPGLPGVSKRSMTNLAASAIRWPRREPGRKPTLGSAESMYTASLPAKPDRQLSLFCDSVDRLP